MSRTARTLSIFLVVALLLQASAAGQTYASPSRRCPFGGALADGCRGAQARGTIVDANLLTPQQVVAVNVVAGTRYTDGTGYIWTSTGGGCALNATGTIDVIRGKLTHPVVTSAGRGCTSRPAIRIPPGAGHGDGGALAPTTYQRTPHNASTPFNMPGVDYAVGVDTALRLKDPTVGATLPACAVANGASVTVTASSCTLDGYDFATHHATLTIAPNLRNVMISNSRFQTAADGGDAIRIKPGACEVTLAYDELTDGARVGGRNANSVAVVFSQCFAGAIVLKYSYCHDVWYKCVSYSGVPASASTLSVTERYNVFRNVSLGTNVSGHGEAEYSFSGTARQRTAIDCEFNTYWDEWSVAAQPIANNSQTASNACGEADGVTLVSPKVAHNVVLGPGPWAATGSDNSHEATVTGSADIFGGHQEAGVVSGRGVISDNFDDYTGKWFPFNPTRGTMVGDYAVSDINAVTGNACNTSRCN